MQLTSATDKLQGAKTALAVRKLDWPARSFTAVQTNLERAVHWRGFVSRRTHRERVDCSKFPNCTLRVSGDP
jgi:hypothetical protein